MRLMALSLLSLIASGGVALADTCDNFKSPAQVLNGLSSSDNVSRLEAKTCGLNSDDPAIRGVVFQNLLVGIDTMSFDVNPEPKDTVGAQVINQMPQFVVNRIKWATDGRTFIGYQSDGGPALGQFLGESLGITFENALLAPLKAQDQPKYLTCSATLTLPKGGTQLVGTLRCTGIASRFIITLGI